MGVSLDALEPIHKILFEVVKDGKHTDSSYLPVPDGPVYLLLSRRNGRLVFATSADFAAFPVTNKGIELDLPPTVKIGLTASNISAKPFTATFENFALITDPQAIDALLKNATK